MTFYLVQVVRLLPLILIAGVASIAFVEPAFAQALGNVENVLQNIVDALTGNVARLIAIIAVVLVGLAWMFNMVDLRQAGMVVVGIAVVFGATEIVPLLTGS